MLGDFPGELQPVELRRRVDAATLGFETTETVSQLESKIGQPRAFEAIEFGLQTLVSGFNIFVAGSPGSGRETTVLDAAGREAATRPAPPDWIYVNNFQDPERPIAIPLPAGMARRLERGMRDFITSARRDIPRAFESEEVQRRRDAIVNELAQQRGTWMQELQAFAASKEYTVEMTPSGIITIPLVAGQPVQKESFAQLPGQTRSRIEAHGREVQEQIGVTMRTIRQAEKSTGDACHQVENEVVGFVTGQLFAELRELSGESEPVQQFLRAVEADLPEHLHDFWPAQDGQARSPMPEAEGKQRDEHLARYQINVLIDNSGLDGAPVVLERNPTLSNLTGRIDYRAILGAMVTDFRQIRPGALHRANGGFLVVHMSDLLRNAQAWEALKRALIAEEIVIENLGDQLSLTPAVRLHPAPIPLDVKVVLIGPHALYQLLISMDDDFGELFAVRADFAPDMEWSGQAEKDYAAFISRYVREQGLLHFDAPAVARVIEQSGRLREDQHRLTTHFGDITNLVTEASHWATRANRSIVTREDVVTAIAKQTYRSNLLEERIREFINDGTIAISTAGDQIGQVNGLAVLDTGTHAFGHPVRVTARVAVGRGMIQSIEREIEFDGPIHSKGFLTLSGYLMGQYGTDWPISASAMITFEQQYEEIDGDSASSTELYALLSALSGIPVRQNIAVTGSVNQHGEIQAIGGANQKIEGYFAICQARGLTGDQGVLIPATSSRTLMLNDEVLAAVEQGQFHIWVVNSVDEGITLLTGRPAGQRGEDGRFAPDSVHALVQERLAMFMESARLAGGDLPNSIGLASSTGALPGG